MKTSSQMDQNRRITPTRRWQPLKKAMAALVVASATLTVTAPATAQGTGQVFPDPMGFDAMAELLEPLHLSEQQRQFVRSKHRDYIDQYRVLRETRIAGYLEDVGSMALEYVRDREKIVDGQRRTKAILSQIEQLETTFFEQLRPILSDQQAESLPRVVDRRARRRLSSQHGSWDWSMPALSNLDMSRVIDQVELPRDQLSAIDEMLAAYELELTPIFKRIHNKRLELPLAHHDQTAAARAAFEQSIEDRKAELAETMDRMEQVKRDMEERATDSGASAEKMAGLELRMAERERLLKERAIAMENEYAAAQAWSPATSNQDLNESKDVRKDIARISRMNRRLLDDMRSVMDSTWSNTIERRYFQRSFSMLSIPGDPLRRRVNTHLNSEETAEDLKAALTELYAGYIDGRRPLVGRMVGHAEQNEFLNTQRSYTIVNGQLESAAADNDIEETRQSIKDLNERSLAEYAALTGEDLNAGNRRIVRGPDGEEIVLDGIGLPDGAQVIQMQTAGAGADGDVIHSVSTFVATTELPVLDLAADASVDSFIHFEAGGIAWDGAVANMEVMTESDGTGGVRVVRRYGTPAPRGWLPGPLTQEQARSAATLAGVPDDQLSIVDAIYDDYRGAFDALNESMVNRVKESVRKASRFGPRQEDDSPPDIDRVYGGVHNAMDAILGLDQDLFENLAVLVAGGAESPAIVRAQRKRHRHAYRHLGQGTGTRFFGGGNNSREHEVDMEVVVDQADLEAEQRDLLMPVIDQYGPTAVDLMSERWHGKLNENAERARQMQKIMSGASGDGNAFSYMVMSDLEAKAAAGGKATQGVNYEQRLSDLNYATLTQLLDLLDPMVGRVVDDVYRRTAFPSVFADHESVHGIFDRAANIELTASQRDRLRDLAATYRAEYAECCDRMIEMIRTMQSNGGNAPSGPFMVGNPEYFEALQKHQQDMEVERFTRRNLNQSTLQALHDMFDPETRDKLGIKSED